MKPSRQIDVRAQYRLPARRVFALCIRGIRHRLLRAALTLAVVALAVAFLMYLLCENALYLAVGRGLDRQIDRSRTGIRLVARVLTPAGEVESRWRLAEAHRDAAARAELAAVSGWAPERVAALAAACAAERRYADFFDRLPVGKRTLLIGRRTGREGVELLADPVRREELERALKPMVDVRVPDGVAALFALARETPARETERRAFAAAWNAAVARAAAAMAARAGDEAPEAWLATAPAEAAEAWRLEAAARGFAIAPETFALARRQLANARLRRLLLQRLDSPAGRQVWRKVFREPRIQSAERRLRELGTPKAQQALAAILALPGQADPVLAALPPAQFAALAADERRERRLAALERRLVPYLDGRQGGGLTGRQQVLLVISFLVCMVGIANAMLMSITERFREIATLKCLGATDRYVLLQFLLEAGLQGVAGGVLGVATGFLAAHLKGLAELGGDLLGNWPGAALAGAGGAALLAGVLLSMLASVYPSWTASRMAPMEAMRVE